MANIELKHLCLCGEDDYIKAEFNKFEENTIDITGVSRGEEFDIKFDKSTAIRFAKTLRTEINKIEE
jgi:hypothetical protein